MDKPVSFYSLNPGSDGEPIKATIGQWADYFDTGMWTMTSRGVVAPDDLTISQLKDFLIASGGAVYLRQDGKFVWIPRKM